MANFELLNINWTKEIVYIMKKKMSASLIILINSQCYRYNPRARNIIYCSSRYRGYNGTNK